MTEVIGGFQRVVKPLEEITKREKTLIKSQHHFWVCVLCGRRNLPVKRSVKVVICGRSKYTLFEPVDCFWARHRERLSSEILRLVNRHR